MSEKPILFSGPMVRAILEGRKTQTRRVIKPQPVGYPDFYTLPVTFGHGLFPKTGSEIQGSLGHFYPPDLELYSVEVLRKKGGLAWHVEGFSPPNKWTCPYGTTGDRLWVRETFLNNALPDYPPVYLYRADGDEKPSDRVWRPSIFMPRAASRITLEITNVRVERLNEISDTGALAEGVDQTNTSLVGYATERFKRLWDKINGKKYPWASNPWVWVVEFKKK